MPDAAEERLLAAGLRALRESAGSQPFPRVFEHVGAALMVRGGAERCVCAVLGPEGHIESVHGLAVEGERLAAPARDLSHFLLRQVTRAGQTVFVEDARTDRRWRSEEDQRSNRPVRSLAGIPIFAGERLAAVVCLSHGTAPLEPAVGGSLVFFVAQILGLALPAAASARERAPEAAAPPPPRIRSTDVVAWRGFVTRSAALKEVLATAERIARSDMPVLIVGEDGTGKDDLARAIHEASGVPGPFVVVSAGSIPDSLLEGELFGHVKGAFTGAEVDRRGLIAEADGGTLFFSDLSVMSEALQAALLRVLAEGMVRPLGSDTARHVRFRLMAATALAPEELRRQRIVRDDLLYRLQGITLTLPPLRDRPGDIGLLFDRYLAEGGTGPAPRLTKDAERFLLLHAWPGNVRELRNEAHRLRAVASGEIRPQDLSFVVPGAPAAAVGAASTLRPLAEAVKNAEQEQIERALALANGNKSEAARLLGVTRRSLYRRLGRYGMRA